MQGKDNGNKKSFNIRKKILQDRYSVLMAVYHRENPSYLEASMKSIFQQTVPTEDFVLVCDGPLGRGLENVIDQMQENFGDVLHIVRLEENRGLGNALNEGIQHCRNELIARMDSDDIARPERCERQLEVFEVKPDIAICSGIVEEFAESPDVVCANRILPESQEEILEFAKRRNPFNHPCVMFKKSAVKAVGGYQDFYLLEDYYLWVRMLLEGFEGYNLQKPLLWMRAGSSMYKRRSGWKYARSQAALFKFMEEQGFISHVQYVESSFIRTAASMAPNCFRKFMFERVLRDKGFPSI